MKNTNEDVNNKATAQNLVDGNFDPILNKIKDNEDGLIEASDIRDVIYTLSSNLPIKEFNNYIGIDSDLFDGTDDLPILIGKREIHNNPVMGSYTEGTYSDIIIYNTKDDNVNQDETTVGFLSGSDVDSFHLTPIMKAKKINDQTVIFGFSNRGDINLKSLSPLNSNNSTSVHLNKLRFPSISENIDLNGKYLTGTSSTSLEWKSFSQQIPGDEIGDENSKISFNDLKVNGHSLQFNDSRYIPKSIGNIKQGQRLENYSLSEILKMIIYPYLPPTASIKFLPPYENGFVEIGSRPDVRIEYTINKKTNNTIESGLINMNPGNVKPVINEFFVNHIGITNARYQPLPIIPVYKYSFRINVSDGTESFSTEISSEGIYPIFHKIGADNSLSGAIKILNKGNQDIFYIGNGFTYFYYPDDYGQLSDILDENDISIINDFNYTITKVISPDGYWSKNYYIYNSINSNNYTVPQKIRYIF